MLLLLARQPLKKAVSKACKTANYMEENCKIEAEWILHEQLVEGHDKLLGERAKRENKRQCCIMHREKVSEGKLVGDET